MIDKTLTVTKRNGSIEPLDIDKIKAMVDFGFELSTDLHPNELIQKLSIAFYDGIATADIQKVIIHEAKLFIVENGAYNNQWSVVVGRLEAADLHGQIHKNTGLNQSDFIAGYEMLREQGFYNFDIDDYLLEEAQNIIDLENDFKQPTQTIVSLMSQYLIKSELGYIEYPQWAILADSCILSDSVEELRENYLMLKTKAESASTPVKKNLRIGGNTASCFSLSVEDDIEDIMDTLKDAALISKSGGGMAVYVGKIRPELSAIRGIPEAATHVNKWVKFFDLVAYTVDQTGSRKGAITVSNDWYHLDFLEFITVSSEDGGDIRKKSFDILPQYLFNNYLLKQVKTRSDVYLVNNYECINKLGIDLTELIGNEWEEKYKVVLDNLDIITHKKVNAYTLWTEMWSEYFKVGKINITNKDNINSNNYLRDHYKAMTANLCVESYSINTKEYDHTCNLMSINLAEIVNNNSELGEVSASDRLRRVTRHTVDTLNKLIDISTFPTKETKASAIDLRNTGIGLVGGADWLAYNNMTYNQAGINELERVMEEVAYYAYERSIELAEIYGPYPLFKKARYDKVFKKTPETLNAISPNGFDWVSLINRLKTRGIRNFLLLSPAPNAGTGVVLGASPNYLPVTSLCHFKDMQSMTPIIVPPFADTKFPYYRTRGSFEGEFFLKVSAAIQKWSDTGVSNEIGVNPDIFSMKDFSDTLIELMLNDELNAVYYMAETSCTSCAN